MDILFLSPQLLAQDVQAGFEQIVAEGLGVRQEYSAATIRAALAGRVAMSAVYPPGGKP